MLWLACSARTLRIPVQAEQDRSNGNGMEWLTADLCSGGGYLELFYCRLFENNATAKCETIAD